VTTQADQGAPRGPHENAMLFVQGDYWRCMDCD
jgi:hypothetical protein